MQVIQVIVIYLCIHEKLSATDCLTNLPERKLSMEFVWKILKLKMGLVGSKSRSNILIRKRIRTQERKKHLGKSGNNTLETVDIKLTFLYPGIFANQAYTSYFPQPN